MVGVAKSYGLLMSPLMDEFSIDLTVASLGMAVGAGIYTITGIIEIKVIFIFLNKMCTVLSLYPHFVGGI